MARRGPRDGGDARRSVRRGRPGRRGVRYFQRCPMRAGLAGAPRPRRVLPGPPATKLDEALAKLNRRPRADLGLPQYLRGLALASLPPDPDRAAQAVADLEFVLAVRDQFRCC